MLMAKPAPSWSLLAGSRQAVPAHMPAAAVPEAGDMPDEDLVRAEWVSVRATRRRAGHLLAIRRLKKIAQHNQKGKPICVNGFVHASFGE
jgi:hypothetical protein